LVYLEYKLIIEYEGDQHRTNRSQWNRDIVRHEDFARDRWTLIRVTSERARRPRQVVRGVYQALKANGYTGPAPRLTNAGPAFSSPVRSNVTGRPICRAELVEARLNAPSTGLRARVTRRRGRPFLRDRGFFLLLTARHRGSRLLPLPRVVRALLNREGTRSVDQRDVAECLWEVTD
jgi:hypothetical protein